ncbi:MAG: hypothetical protein AB1397_00275, partial [bacterium]
NFIKFSLRLSKHIHFVKRYGINYKTNIIVENSKARRITQMPNQKVIFKINQRTCGEIEMRNDSEVHYREIKFWLSKIHIVNLLFEKIVPIKQHSNKILVYGKAIKKFGRWS